MVKVSNREIRLSEKELGIILSLAQDMFGKDIELYLFGSRADINSKGGDIDLLLISNDKIDRKKEFLFLARLEINGIERHVDLVVMCPGRKLRAIHKEALEKGVRLL